MVEFPRHLVLDTFVVVLLVELLLLPTTSGSSSSKPTKLRNTTQESLSFVSDRRGAGFIRIPFDIFCRVSGGALLPFLVGSQTNA